MEKVIANDGSTNNKMNTIYKYPLILADVQNIEMPLGAQILCVQIQKGSPYLWAKVDTKAPPMIKTIYIHGTGHQIHKCANKYIGTYQLLQGDYVFHVFETWASK